MNRIAVLVLLSTLFVPSVFAKGGHFCADQKILSQKKSFEKTALASPLLELYDVKYVKLDISMSNLNTDISGSTQTNAIVAGATNMSQYAFELNNNLTIDSVLVNAVKLTPSSVGTHVLAVTLPSSLAPGTAFTALVYYHGTAQNGTGFFTHGLNQKVLSTSTPITFSLSDPDLAKDWWACKQSLTDKIDSADLWFTVPNGTKAGSNGRLQGTTLLGGGLTRYEWKTRYPIEYYLISVAVAPYDDHTQTVYFSGSSDSMPMQHYVLDTATFYPQYKSAIDSTPGMIDYLSTLYGRYPFWKEKYGHCIAPLSGGMEHQTMTTLGVYTTPLIAHELGHQWWGDAVTYASWRDIWLSEGWASYTEQLYVEHFRSKADAKAYRSTVFNRVLTSVKGSVYVDDTSTVNRIFDSRLTYDKGASVAHTLRYLAPNDAAFFNGLKAYQQQYAYKTATTADFQKVMETAYGRSLDTFFNQWVYGQGYPTYTVTWNQKGNDVFLKLDQTASWPASVTAFALPVLLKLSGSTSDTLVSVYLNSSSQLYSFKWNQNVTNISVDPNDDILNKEKPAIYDPQLSVASAKGEEMQVYPNPTKENWKIKNMPSGTRVSLFDISGKRLWMRKSVSGDLEIPAVNLAPGVYTLSLENVNGETTIRLLEKN